MIRVRIMETLLLKMLAVQNQILATHQEILVEVRLLRQALEKGAPEPAPAVAAPVASVPAATPGFLPEPPAATPEPEPVAGPVMAEPDAPPPEARPASRGRGMLTVDELTDLGGQFLEPGMRSRSKVKPVEAADLLDEIKSKNKAKRDAFAEFDRLRRDR